MTLRGGLLAAAVVFPLLTVAVVRIVLTRLAASDPQPPVTRTAPATQPPASHPSSTPPSSTPLTREQIRSRCLSIAAQRHIAWDTISAVADAPGVLFSLDEKDSGRSLAACTDQPPYLIDVDY
jgi:hypothetical protein